MAQKVTPKEIIYNADLAAKQAMNRLDKDSLWLHENGYGQWSAALSNMRHKIETALHELVNEVLEG